jgi:hypothetical protein
MDDSTVDAAAGDDLHDSHRRPAIASRGRRLLEQAKLAKGEAFSVQRDSQRAELEFHWS